MQPAELFAHCPRCGAALAARSNPLACSHCHFTFFFNPTVAAAAFVFNDRGEVIVLRRAKEPQKDKLTVPGGFLDIGETAEAGLAREVREEVGLEIAAIRFVLSEPNLYPFKDVLYPVCDLIFAARAVNAGAARPLDGALSCHWRALESLDEREMAFPSVIKGLRALRAGA
jgi:mutator protein MutT